MLSTDRTYKAAEALSHLLSPAGVAVAVFSSLALGAGWRASWPSGLAGILLYAVVPGGALLALKRREALSSIYDPPTALRQRILLAGAACYLLGFGALSLLPTPAAMRWAAASFFCGAALVWLIDRVWKISIHSVGVGGGVLVLLIWGGPHLWPLLSAAPLVAWARLHLGAHSPAQVASGLILGAAIPLAIRPLFV